MGKCILRVNVLWMQSVRWPLCVPHGFNHVLCAPRPLAHIKELYKSSLDLSEWCCVSPVSQFCMLWGNPVFLKQNNCMEQEENFVSRTHSSWSALALCVRHLNGFVCGFRGIWMRRTLFLLCSHLVPSKIIKEEGFSRGWGGCQHQTGYLCQSWPICSGPVPSLVVPLFTMEEKRFMLLPHAALVEWVCVVEREPHSLLGLEWFYLSKLRKNKTLAEAWTAVVLEKN